MKTKRQETDFEKARRSGKTWSGHPVIATWEFGNVGIVKSDYPHKESEHRFSVFLNGYSIGFASDSLDNAIIEALAIKYDGRNSNAGRYFARMINLPTQENAI